MIAATHALETTRATLQPAASSADMTAVETATEPGNETTYSANATASGPVGASSEGTKTIVKKKGKAKLSAREKKERSLSIERIVNTLPLEFRGSDPNLRRQIEIVIEGFLDREGRGLTSMLLFLSRMTIFIDHISSHRVSQTSRPEPGTRQQMPDRPREQENCSQGQ